MLTWTGTHYRFQTMTQQLSDVALAALGWATAKVDRTNYSLYSGLAGVLLAHAELALDGFELAEARGIRDLLLDAVDPEPRGGLYVGRPGVAAALLTWARITGDGIAHAAAETALLGLADSCLVAEDLPAELLTGAAGILLCLLAADAPRWDAIEHLADHCVAARARDAAEWHREPGNHYPGFSHGTAGVAFALLAAGIPLDRADLVGIAKDAARRLITLGEVPGGFATPLRVGPAAPRDVPFPLGWCHGPTGTLRLFDALARHDPNGGWRHWVERCRSGVRRSGLPTRLYPGFWDNVGACCGTAGVGEMALDAFQGTGDASWLAWSHDLAREVLSRANATADGTCWHNIEHRRTPSRLPAEAGWAMGSAGIAGWLWRLHRIDEHGATAPVVLRPDALPPLAAD